MSGASGTAKSSGAVSAPASASATTSSGTGVRISGQAAAGRGGTRT
ncbi:hypothetical protein [Brevibacterium ihuae]|nr:hypothetical protein [Brevibacterium ihuae]